MSRTRRRLRRSQERAARGAGIKELAMKFMLMMNAPRGNGDWNLAAWAPEDVKAHIKFMKGFGEDLRKAGELVAAEGLASPGQARIVRAGKGGAPEVTDGPFAEAKEFL